MAANYYDKPGEEVPLIDRLRYFDERFLTDQDFVDEQMFHVAAQRRHVRGLHAPGVVQGLRVLSIQQATGAGTWTATLEPGFAYDRFGRQILLAGTASVALPIEGFDADAEYQVLYIEFGETPGGATQDAGVGVDGHTRFTPTPRLFLYSPTSTADRPGVPLATFEVPVEGPPRFTERRDYAGVAFPSSGAAVTVRSSGEGIIKVEGAVSAVALDVTGALHAADVQAQQLRVIGPLAASSVAAASLRVEAAVPADGNGYALTARTGTAGTGTIAVRGGNLLSPMTYVAIDVLSGGSVGVARVLVIIGIDSGGNRTFLKVFDAVTQSAPMFVDYAEPNGTGQRLTLEFQGELSAGDRYEFRSALAPMVRHLGMRGETRSVVDHNGFRAGKVVERVEDYLGLEVHPQQPATIQTVLGETIPGTILVGSYRIGTASVSVEPHSLMSSAIVLKAGSGEVAVGSRQLPMVGRSRDVGIIEWGALIKAAGTVALGFAYVRFEAKPDEVWKCAFDNGSERVATNKTPVVGIPQRFRIEIYGPDASPITPASAAIYYIDDEVVFIKRDPQLIAQWQWTGLKFAVGNGAEVEIGPVRIAWTVP